MKTQKQIAYRIHGWPHRDHLGVWSVAVASNVGRSLVRYCTAHGGTAKKATARAASLVRLLNGSLPT